MIREICSPFTTQQQTLWAGKKREMPYIIPGRCMQSSYQKLRSPNGGMCQAGFCCRRFRTRCYPVFCPNSWIIRQRAEFKQRPANGKHTRMLEDRIWIQGTQDKVEEWSKKNKAQGGQDWFYTFSNNGTVTILSTLSAQGVSYRYCLSRRRQSRWKQPRWQQLRSP